MDNIVHTFVVPTAVGAAHAVAAPTTEPKRALLLGLLQGGSSQPVPMTRLAELANLPDRKAVGAELFRLQRNGWVSGELEPFSPPNEPLQESLPALLQALSDRGRGVLADHNGLCVASVGYDPGQTKRLCAWAVRLHAGQQSVRSELPGAEAMPLTMTIEGADPEHSLSVRSIYLGQRCFHLLLAGTNQAESPVFVRLVAVLARRYLGEV